MKSCLYIMDDLSSVKVEKDTSYFLMLASYQLGHEVYHCQVKDLVFQEKAYATTLKLKVNDSNPIFETKSQDNMYLENFDYIWIRKDPPFDANYLYLSQILETVPNVKIINHPRSIRDWNEKLSILNFLEHSPWTLVSQNFKEIEKTLSAKKGRFVLKPLDGFGGKGIDFLSTDEPDWQTRLNNYIQKENKLIMIQAYVPEAKDGDKRVLLWRGEVLGAILRMHPNNSEINNLDAGGEAYPSQLTDKEKIICESLKSELKARQLDFVGIDLIGEKLTEINVTSPTGLQQLCRFSKRDFHKEIISSI